jgi:universal stress protein A
MIEIRRILVPMDFSECSRRGLRYAVAMAERFGSEIVLVHAIEAPLNLPPQTLVRLDPEGPAMPIMDYVREAADRRLNAMLAELSLASIPAQGVISVGDVRDIVLESAKTHNVDMIVMGTNGRKGLRHLLIGSVAEDIVRRSEVPVLTTRMHEEHSSAPPSESAE